MKIVSILGLITAIATAITSQVTAINLKWGAWVMLAGTVAAASGGALAKFGAQGPIATGLGVVMAVSGALAMATDVIPSSIAALIAIVGTAAAAAGKSLFGWEEESAKPLSGGPRAWMLAGLVLAGTLPLAACGAQTTLDRVASVLTTAVNGYQLQLDQLKGQGILDEAKYNRLTIKNSAIRKQVEELGRVISGFGTISSGDVPRILQQIDAVAGVAESSLTDPAWTGVGANVDALRALRWIRATLSTTAVVVAGLFPPKPSPTPTTAGSVPQVRAAPAIAPARVKVDLPRIK